MSRVYFTDRDLGKKFGQILRDAGLTVERHGDHFAHDCPDEEWLQGVGERQWVAITHDRRIRYKPRDPPRERSDEVRGERWEVRGEQVRSERGAGSRLDSCDTS